MRKGQLLSYFFAALLTGGAVFSFFWLRSQAEIEVNVPDTTTSERVEPIRPKLSHSVLQKIESVEGLSPTERAARELSTGAEVRSNLEILGQLLQQDQSTEFLTRVNQLIADHPNVAEYVAIKADYYYMDQNWVAAEETVERLLELDPENILARGTLGELKGILGKYDEGLQTLDIVLERDPANLQALYGVISISDLQGQSDLGIKRILDLADQHPQSGNIAVVKADILFSQGKRAERREVLSRAMESDPTNPHPFRVAASDALRDGDYEESRKLSEQSLERDRDEETRRQSYDIAIKAAMASHDLTGAEAILHRKKQELPWDESVDLALEAIKQARSSPRSTLSEEN